MSRLSLILISILILLAPLCGTYAIETGQHAHVFEYRLTYAGNQVTARMNYLLFLPSSYGKDPQYKWPLIMFFHGAGGIGDNVNIIKNDGIPYIVEQNPDFPFVALSPQIPNPYQYTWVWNEPALYEVMTALLDNIIANYAVDVNRVYLTGASLGGRWVWGMAIAHPEKYAAIAPVCGAVSYPSQACALKDVPVWAFHGAKDTDVSIWTTDVMVDAIKACGGDVKYTVYPDLGHDIWRVTYTNQELYDWFLSHSLQKETPDQLVTSVQPVGKAPIKWGSIKMDIK